MLLPDLLTDPIPSSPGSGAAGPQSPPALPMDNAEGFPAWEAQQFQLLRGLGHFRAQTPSMRLRLRAAIGVSNPWLEG